MPVLLYRVVRATHPPFDGSGAARFGARWTSPGRSAIYTSRSYAGALLEVLAHARRADLRTPYHSVVVHVPDNVAFSVVRAEDVLGWDDMDYAASRAVGDAWHERGDTALLDVPSVLGRPHERNVIIHPHQPVVRRLRIDPPQPVIWDSRLAE